MAARERIARWMIVHVSNDMTARELLKFRRALINVLGRERANDRTRAMIKYQRTAKLADDIETLKPALASRIRRNLECAGSHARGIFHCECGAESPNECDRR